jgi:L-alanine-DL-glutamate epimerase-like enolase superfamily enzyme
MKITAIDVFQIDLAPHVVRRDAIQAFTKQETVFVRVRTDDGAEGLGYTYTIGTGGAAIMALIRRDLEAPLLGENPLEIEKIWKKLWFASHATVVGAITSLALCAIDTALWDLRCRTLKQPLHILLGGAKDRIPVYDTEGGWLNIELAELVAGAKASKAKGLLGVKVKVGRPTVQEDMKRLEAVRKVIGDEMELMVDANQGFTVSEAIRRTKAFEPFQLAWMEEPMPAEDLNGHIRLSQSTATPIAVGESIYSVSHFREYMQKDACSIIQVDVGRIGGITPWMKVAHIAEGFNMAVCPHYLMELHLPLCCAIPNSLWLEYIPQLSSISAPMKIDGPYSMPSQKPGLGIDWDLDKMNKLKVNG